MVNKFKIVMASDHAGYQMKKDLQAYMESLGHTVYDIGADDTARAEYPIYGRLAADKLAKGEADRAVLVCGTGFGIALAANSVHGVRCVNCIDPFTTTMSRLHNNTNAIAFGARVIAIGLARQLLDIWLTTAFEGGRHADRVNMLTEMYNNPQPDAYTIDGAQKASMPS